MTNNRVGYDPVRKLTFIRAVVVTDWSDDLMRCETCGRASNCCCSTACPCPANKLDGYSKLQRALDA